jgi:hypothetical protein
MLDRLNERPETMLVIDGGEVDEVGDGGEVDEVGEVGDGDGEILSAIIRSQILIPLDNRLQVYAPYVPARLAELIEANGIPVKTLEYVPDVSVDAGTPVTPPE